MKRTYVAMHKNIMVKRLLNRKIGFLIEKFTSDEEKFLAMSVYEGNTLIDMVKFLFYCTCHNTPTS